jgi:hypothetical protein
MFSTIGGSGYEVDSRRRGLTAEEEGKMIDGRRSLAFGSIGKGTLKKYEGNWRRYENVVVNKLGSTVGPWLEGGENRRAEEDLLLDVVVYYALVCNFAYSTVAGYLYAVRWVHLSHGFADPLLGKPRLTLACRAVKLKSGACKGKLPASPDMVMRLHDGFDFSDVFHLFLWAAIVLAFFFLLRSSEYASSGGHFDVSRGLLVGDVQFFLRGAPIQEGFHLADEVVLCIRASKADQNGLGVLRNAYATGRPLCPVIAAARVKKLRVEAGATPNEPFLLYAAGKTVDRRDVTAALKWAARSLGQPEADLAPHSLRIGGASCMLACGFTEEDIRRQGRWHSFCWRRYAYDSRERMRGVSEAMAASSYTVMEAGQDFLHRRRGEAL